MVLPVNIPIELFGMLIAVACVFIGIGIVKRVGVSVFVGGLFIVVIMLLTDNIIMGSQVVSSTFNTTSSTTSYTYATVLFQFTQYHKIIGALMGSMIMLVGALVWRQ